MIETYKFPLSFFPSFPRVCFVPMLLLRLARYRTWDLPMNNEILSCAEDRDTSPKMHGEIRARRPPPRGCSISFLSGKRAEARARPTPHDTRGTVCSRRLYQLFRYFRRGARWAVCLRGFCRSFFDALGSARTHYKVYVIVTPRKSSRSAISPDADDDEIDGDALPGAVRQHL